MGEGVFGPLTLLKIVVDCICGVCSLVVEMKHRTPKQIAAEIQALKDCKSYVPKMSAFGDDNHRNIDLQIKALKEGVDETSEEWRELSHSQQSAICEAINWKEGEEDESPSSGWDYLKPKGKTLVEVFAKEAKGRKK